MFVIKTVIIFLLIKTKSITLIFTKTFGGRDSFQLYCEDKWAIKLIFNHKNKKSMITLAMIIIDIILIFL